MHKILSFIIFAFIALAISAAEAGERGDTVVVADGTPKVVIAGNSIAEIWPGSSPQFFADSHWISTGISGETSRQILARFNRDVIGNSPDVVIILSPLSNDIAQNEGSVSHEYMLANVRKMIELAKAKEIRVLLTANTPCAHFYWAPWLKPAGEIVAVNKMLNQLADEMKVEYVDIYTPLAAPDGSFPEVYSYDGCHPTPAGYAVIENILYPLVNSAQ